MIDVIYSGNVALKQDYVQEQEYRREQRQRQEYPVLVHSRKQWEAEEVEEASVKKQLLAGLGMVLLAVFPPVGALVLLGASKCA